MRSTAIFALALVIAALAAAPAEAQPHTRVHRDGVANVPSQSSQQSEALRDLPRVVEPRYVVIPVKIHANDETGPDWAGSDEVFAIFRDPATNSSVRTPTFGNVDTHTTRYFAQAQGCVTPIGMTLAGQDGTPAAWTCRQEGVRAGFSFTVELYEDDRDAPSGRNSYYDVGDPCPPQPDGAVNANCADDLIGRATITPTRPVLLAYLPNVGDSAEFSQRLGGYTFTYKIQRVVDFVAEATFGN